MRKNPHTCDLKDKELLSLTEAAALFGIGQTKLSMLLAMPNCPFRLLNGKKRMILKAEFLRYLAKEQKI